MLKSILFPLIFIYFCELQFSCQKILISDETGNGINSYNGIFEEIEEEDFIFAEAQAEIGSFEGSGSVESTERPFNAPTGNVGDCIESGYGAVCSNRGRCVDAKCVCNSVEIIEDNSTSLYRYSGRYCEECPYCRAQRCHRFLSCIECNLLQVDANCSSYCGFQYEIVDEITPNAENDEKFCDVGNIRGCYFRFKYQYNTQHSVAVQYEKDFFCFDGYRIAIYTFWGVVFYIFALILLVPRICCVEREIEVDETGRHSLKRYDRIRSHVFR